MTRDTYEAFLAEAIRDAKSDMHEDAYRAASGDVYSDALRWLRAALARAETIAYSPRESRVLP